MLLGWAERPLAADRSCEAANNLRSKWGCGLRAERPEMNTSRREHYAKKNPLGTSRRG